mmetsp:Transcript_11232/g.34530  ORF Transcript_11232/g.34530 Transcript_11232/m.34530 type:complete len:231 (+) Transcript_11232:201-893(+)
MKLLENARLSAITAFLTNRHLGDRVIDGRVEAFSCKRAGDDKKLSKQLERQYADEASSSPASLDTGSPFGSLTLASTRKLLVDLISTMNASFPDHDFSGLRPEQFCREASAQFASRACSRHLAELAATSGQDLLAELWAAVEEAIALRDCEVYSYVPDLEADPFSEGVLWSFNYFFFNKSLKRIVYLSCVARSKYAVPNSQDEEADDDEYRIGDDDDELMVAGDFESGEE